MVVLDTGSTDDTKELARQAGALVHEMAWPGSFSEARNRSLELADADWNLVIDADEWIVCGGESLRAWCQEPNRLGTVCVRSSFLLPRENSGENLPSETQNWITRVLPRGARFERRVHEQVVSNFPRIRTEIHLGHDGYLDAQLRVKRDRNRILLLQDLKDYPEDPYILFQLGKESELRKDFGTARELYQQSLAASSENANWKHGLVIRYLFCLGKCEEFDAALIYINQNIDRWNQSPDFFFIAANIALEKAKADPANALDEWIPLARSLWETCLEIGDQPSLEESFQGVGSYLAQANLDAIDCAWPARC